MKQADSQQEHAEKVDVAVNIFAKPFQTALALLSLLQQSRAHIGHIWLQFEPMGSRHDKITPYYICQYLSEACSLGCHASQPAFWLARQPIEESRLADPNYRMGIRYQHAFENSGSRLLFIMHNDVFILRDIIGYLKNGIGDAFAAGSIGQCWNCPAADAGLTAEVMNRGACAPDHYEQFKPDYAQLCRLYDLAKKRGIFARPYLENKNCQELKEQPWPLPECRVNEWACLINLEKSRPACFPYGTAYPPGAFRLCGDSNLDTAAPWFRDMHNLGFHAAHCNISKYIKHWVGTGNKSPARYAIAEDRALRLLAKHYPEYINWLEKKSGQKIIYF